MVSVNYTDGWAETYLVPLAFVSGEHERTVLTDAPTALLARITGARKGAIIDGFLDDDTCSLILDLVEHRTELASTRGMLRGVPSTTIDLAADRKWTRTSGDQSNSVAFVNDQFVLKLFRRIEPGPNPEFELTEFLTGHGFTQVPALAAALLYDRSGLEPGTLAVLQTAIKHQGTGWDVSIDELRRYYERVAPRARRTEGDSLSTPAVPDASTRHLLPISPRQIVRPRSSRHSKAGICPRRRRWGAGRRKCISRWAADPMRRSHRSR